MSIVEYLNYQIPVTQLVAVCRCLGHIVGVIVGVAVFWAAQAQISTFYLLWFPRIRRPYGQTDRRTWPSRVDSDPNEEYKYFRESERFALPVTFATKYKSK